MTSLIIVGAGGFGLEVAAYATDAALEVKGFWDDTKPVGTKYGNHAVIGSTDSTIDASASYILAVGNPTSRRTLAEKLKSKGAKFIILIHPLSYVAASAHIGVGSIIAPFAFVGPEAQVGSHCVMNTHTCVGHESRMGGYCTLSPYAALHGGAVLGHGVFMGSNAIVTAKQPVGAGAKVAAGAIVYSPIPDGALAIGNPAACRHN